MKNNDFRDRIEVQKKDLIPIDSLEKCLWTMKATGKIAHFALITRKNAEEEKLYGNHYWVINHELGDLEYKLRTGEIDEKQFTDGCNEIYYKYNVNFDMLRDDLSDLEKLEQEHTPENENTLSTRLNRRTKEYLNRVQNKKNMEQDHSQQHESNR